MYAHTGTLINGDPVVCGGDSGGILDDVKCFHYERDTKKWKRVNESKHFDNKF